MEECRSLLGAMLAIIIFNLKIQAILVRWAELRLVANVTQVRIVSIVPSLKFC